MKNRTAASERMWLLYFVFGLVSIQGLTVNMMPVILGTMASAFDLNLRQQGQIQSFAMMGGMVALLVSGYVTEYIRPKRSGVMALLFIGTGCLLLGSALSYGIILLAAAVVGLGNAWILAAYSAVITSRFPENRQRMFLWVGAVFAAAASVGPYVLGYSLDITPNWRWVFLAFGLFIWIWLAALLMIAGKRIGTFPEFERADTSTVDSQKSLIEKLRDLRGFLFTGLFNRYALWLLGLLVILDNLATITIVTWTPRFFQLEYGLLTAPSSLFLSTLAVGVFLGRLFLAAFVSGKLSDRKLLGYCYAGAMASYAVILLEPGYTASVFLMGLVGAFASAQAPTVYSLASAKFRKRAATAIPLTDAIGSAGGLMGPTVIGFLADRIGSLHRVLWLSIPAGGLLVVIALIWEWLDTDKSVAVGSQSSSA